MMTSSNGMLKLIHSSSCLQSLRHRLLSTCSIKMVPLLSPNYRSEDKWLERRNTELLRNVEPNKYFSDLLNRLNNGASLYATDLDIFVNVAEPGEHLEECVYLIRQLRTSLKANTILPSTHHAVCRLFLNSNRLAALVDMMEARVNYGLFPDSYAANLILDTAIDKQYYALAARTVATIMIQEEFGMNVITDLLSFYSLIKYLHEDKDFNNWTYIGDSVGLDDILGGIADQSSSTTKKKEDAEEKAKKEENAAEEEEDEEEYEYVRIPFLRNEYFDNHFDLKEPRQMFGKSLAMLGEHLEDDVCNKNSQLLGNVIFGSLEKACNILETMIKDSSTFASDTLGKCDYYLNNLHNLNEPSESSKDKLASLINKVDKARICDLSMEDLAETSVKRINELEENDSQQLVKTFEEWNKERSLRIKNQMEHILRLKRIQEIKQKKKELEEKEKYLYFYDNLNKSKVDRIRYE